MNKGLLGMLFASMISSVACGSETKKKQKMVCMDLNTKVISDPVNNTLNPKMIPGAKLEFSIVVDNNTDKAISNAKVAEFFEDDKYEYIFDKVPVKIDDENKKMYITLGDIQSNSKKEIKFYAILK
jgi:hypothetical protein